MTSRLEELAGPVAHSMSELISTLQVAAVFAGIILFLRASPAIGKVLLDPHPAPVQLAAIYLAPAVAAVAVAGSSALFGWGAP